MYLSWHHPPTFLSVTYPRHCSVHPKPLGYLLTEEKRRRVTRKLHMLGWAEKTLEQVNSLMILIIQRPRQRTPPIFPTLGGAACVRYI